MSNQDSTSEFDKALDLMESSSDSSDKKWEDLKDVEMNLISGYPNIKFENAASPMASGMTMAEFFRQLQCVKHFLCTKWIFI